MDLLSILLVLMMLFQEWMITLIELRLSKLVPLDLVLEDLDCSLNRFSEWWECFWIEVKERPWFLRLNLYLDLIYNRRREDPLLRAILLIWKAEMELLLLKPLKKLMPHSLWLIRILLMFVWENWILKMHLWLERWKLKEIWELPLNLPLICSLPQLRKISLNIKEQNSERNKN